MAKSNEVRCPRCQAGMGAGRFVVKSDFRTVVVPVRVVNGNDVRTWRTVGFQAQVTVCRHRLPGEGGAMCGAVWQTERQVRAAIGAAQAAALGRQRM